MATPIPMKPAPPEAEGATITTTLGAIADAQPALQRLAQQTLPVKLAYAVMRMLKAMQDDVQHYEDKRRACVRDHGVTRDPTESERAMGEPGPVWHVRPDRLAEFVAAMMELRAIEVRIDRAPLDLSSLTTCSAQDLLLLDPFVRAWGD